MAPLLLCWRPSYFEHLRPMSTNEKRCQAVDSLATLRLHPPTAAQLVPTIPAPTQSDGPLIWQLYHTSNFSHEKSKYWIFKCCKTLSIQAAKENSRINNTTEERHWIRHFDTYTPSWHCTSRESKCIVTAFPGIVQCYWRGQQWLYQHSRDDRVSPRSLRRRRGRGGNQSDIFQNWCHRRQNHRLLGVWSLYHEHLYPNWHSDLQSVMNRIKNAGWKKVQRKRNKNGSISTRISDLRCQSILYLLLPHPNYKSCQRIFAKYNFWRRLLLRASHFRVSLYGRLRVALRGSLHRILWKIREILLTALQITRHLQASVWPVW